MNIEKIREEFEAAYLADITARTASAIDEGWLERNSDGDYRSYRASGAWWGWQASRESLVIELPSTCVVAVAMTNEWQGYCRGVNECKKVIETAGLKVKP